MTSPNLLREPPQPLSFPRTFTDFSDPGSTQTFALVTPAAGTILQGVTIDCATTFGGGGATLVTISLGIPSDHARFSTPFTVSVSGGAQISNTINWYLFDGSTALTVTITETGGTLNNLTNGRVRLDAMLFNRDGTHGPVSLETVGAAPGSGTVTTVNTGAGLSGGPITGVGTIVNTGVLSVSAGTNVAVTGTAQNPIINSSGGGGGSLPSATRLDQMLVPTNTSGAWASVQGKLNCANPAFGSMVTDPALAMQACNDYAWASQIKNLFVPGDFAAAYVMSGPVFWDQPGNLRGGFNRAQLLAGNIATPTGFLTGIQVEIEPGTKFRYDGFNTATGMWLGPHHRGGIKGGGLFQGKSLFTPFPYPGTHPINYAAIGIACGNGGASFTDVADVEINGFYNAISVGQNSPSGALAENNQFMRIQSGGANWHGISWYNNQSLVNSVFDSNMASACHIFNGQGQDLYVKGGELGGGSPSIAVTTVSVSVLTPYTATMFSARSYTGYKFDVVFTGAAANPQNPDGTFSYGIGSISLPSFGLVPIYQSAVNTGTNTITYNLLDDWVWQWYTDNGGVALDTNTDFNTELVAVTSIDLTENCAISTGGIKVQDAHYEHDNGSVVRLWENGFNTGPASFERLILNTRVVGSVTNASANRISRAYPTIRQTNGDFQWSSCLQGVGISLGAFSLAHWPISFSQTYNNRDSVRMIFNGGGPQSPNMMMVGSSNSVQVPAVVTYNDTLTTRGIFGSKANGGGEWDRNPWSPCLQNHGANDDLPHEFFPQAGGTSNIAFEGFRPAAGSMQRVTSADVVAMTASSFQVMLYGGQIAQISDTGSYGASTVIDIGGPFLPYYRDMAITGTAKGQSQYVAITGGADRSQIYPGLEFIMATDVSQTYVVVNIDFDTPSQTVVGVSVKNITVGRANDMISGVKTTSYAITVFTKRPRVLSFQGQVRSDSNPLQFDKTSSTALAAITGMGLPVWNGRKYKYIFNASTTSNVAGGVNFDFNGGTATVSAIGGDAFITDTAAVVPVTQTRIAALNTAFGVTAVTVAAVRVTGTFVASSDGTFIPRFAQNASNGAASSVLANATIELTEVT